MRILILAILAAISGAHAQADECRSCGRRQLDSLNYHFVNPIRVNQVGYLTQDLRKIAFVGGDAATPKANEFRILDASGLVVHSGQLEPLGKFDSLKGRMFIRGYNASIFPGYNFGDSLAPARPEYLWKASFGSLRTEGRYRIAVGPDTSQPFDIRKNIYNDVFETSLKFFGAQRCGAAHSWFHKDCHTKDGSALGHAGELQGGWHDCGDHGKYGETVGYAAAMLALAYASMPEKAEDRFGANHGDLYPDKHDGVPDLLYEAKVGADYVMNLYRRAKADGLIAKGDMYHSVGNGPGMDHLFWDRPEYQDAQVLGKGGPDRPVSSVIGGNVAGMFVASLALVGAAWEPFDAAVSKEMLDAAIDIYDKVLIPHRYRKTVEPCCYDGGGQIQDDPALAAVALWHATRQSRFGFDLYQNTAYGQNPQAIFNPGMFAAGLLGNGAVVAGATGGSVGYFDLGGWTTDFQQTNQLAVYAFGKLILKDTATALKYGIGSVLRDSLLLDVMTSLRRGIQIGSNGRDNRTYPGIKVDQPYLGVFTSGDWGFNRYNMGKVTELFLYWDLVRTTRYWERMRGRTVPGRLARKEIADLLASWTEATDSAYLKVGLQNLDYQLGLNPWDISFVMGMGAKNLQHPHNRAANPEGYNAGGSPYPYKRPDGALMGGCRPGKLLLDYWQDYTVTETCIDFSAQLIFPTYILSEDLPPDNEGPVFQDVAVVFVSDSSAIVTWRTNELSTDTLFYSLSPNGPVIGKVAAALALNKSGTLSGLTPNTTYYFRFKGMDRLRNISYDNNRGRDYQFTTTSSAVAPPRISDIRVCNIRSDRATVFWWTDVVAPSAVEYAVEGADFASTKKRVEVDDDGVPGRFHKVTLKNLAPGTAYRFDVISGPARDDSSGRHHRFSTTLDFANYSVKMKATNKNQSGASAQFYLFVQNLETKPYTGLKLRVYFKASAADASQVVIHSSDNAMFGGGGIELSTGVHPQFSKALPYGTTGDIWYIEVTIPDELPVSGSATIDVKFDRKEQYTDYGKYPFSLLADGWSFAPHATPRDPVDFPGIDFGKLWKERDLFERLPDGFFADTYTENPYVTLHYQGEHIHGYPPDGLKPKVFRTTLFDFAAPSPSPATSVKQDSLRSRFGGRTWSLPDVVAAQWQVDGPGQRPASPLAGQTDSVAFAHDTLDAQGANVHEFAFWGDRDSSYCSCAWQRYLVSVDTMKIPPPRYRLVWTPAAGPLREYVGKPLRVSLRLNSDSLDTVKLDAAVSLALPAGIRAGASAADSLGVGPIRLVGGVAEVWLFTSAPESAFSIAASATISGATVDPATLSPISFLALPPWPVVDSAWTRDADCDGAPDSVVVALSQEPGAGVALVSLSASLDGVATSVPPASISRDGRILSFAAPAGLSGSTSGAGSLAIHVTSGGRDLDTSLPFAIVDRTGPVALAASALERFAPGLDTVRVSFSEPVRSNGAWPFVQSRAGMPLSAPTGAAVGNPLPALLEWSLSGTSFLAGDILGWSAPSAVVDAAGNFARDCRAPGAVALRRGSVPLDGASLVDADGDGRVDSLRLRFRRGLGIAELPDSVMVSWGAPSASWILPAAAVTRSTDSATLSAPVAFAWGATSWAGTGNNVLVAQGDAVSGRRDFASAADQVGPVLLSAVLRRGPTADTLKIRVSESVAAGAGADLQRRIGGAWNSLLRLSMSDSVTWRLVASQGTFQDGDSVRLAALALGGAWKDAFGNAPAPNAPWIRIQAGDPAPVSAVVLDLDGDGRAESVRLTWDRSPRRGHGFVFAAIDTSGRTVLRTVDSASVAMEASGLGATAVLPDPFPFGTTSGFGAGIQIEVFADGSADSLSFALSDGAGPVATSAAVRYASQGQFLDTLVVRTSEQVVFAGQTFFQVQAVDGAILPVVGVGSWQSTDGRTAWILLDPTSPASTSFRKGDRIRIQPASLAGGTDARGNPALDLGHLENVVFGTRPPRFSLDFLPSTLLKSTGLQAPGKPIEILVRRLGSGAWTTLSGDPAPALGERIGPRIQTNSVFGGSLAVFDNLGVFVAGVDLSALRSAARAGTLETDPAGQYEVWLAWNGTDAKAKPAASGVYVVRLILRRDGDTGKALDEAWLNKVYRIGWMVK